MKKIKHIMLIVVLTIITLQIEAQTCASPIQLPNRGDQWPSLDSFATSEKWLKFTADTNKLIITSHIFGYSLGTYDIIIYENNCATLPLVTTTTSVSGETLTITTPTLVVGNDYLIKLVNSSGAYMKYYLQKFYTTFPTYTLGCSTVTASLPGNCELVCNGSFEGYNQVYNFDGGIYEGWVQNWGSPTWGTADYYNAVLPVAFPNAGYGVPCNSAIYSSAYSGSAYAGIIVHQSTSLYNSEYLETKLTSTLQAGKVYEISFQAKRAPGGYIPVEEIGIFLTTAQITNTIPIGNTSPITNYTYAASTTNYTLLNDFNNWQKVSFTYTSLGGEQFLTIGKTNTLLPAPTVSPGPSNSLCVYQTPPNNNPSAWAYLLIDEVSCKENTSPATFTLPTIMCQAQTLNLNSTATPTGGSFYGTNITYSAGVWYFNAAQNTPPNTYTIVYTYTAGTTCVQTLTITALTTILSVTPTASFTLPTPICQTQTINLNAAVTATGGSFSGTGVTSSSGNYYFNAAQNTPPGTYTLVYAYTEGTVCPTTVTIAAQITIQNTVDINVSASNYVICTNLSQSTSTLNVSTSYTGSLTYTWQPGSSSGNSLAISPSSSSIYTVSAIYLGCVNSSTIAITVNSACCTSTVTAFNANSFTTSTSYVTAPLVFNNDVVIPSGVSVTFYNTEFLFAPNVKITIQPGGDLAILSCHLYGCSDMWQGIVLEDGASMEMFHLGTTYNDNLFEDAITGIDVSSHTTSTLTGFGDILDISYTTFNRNYIAINVYNYQRNQSVYPFDIHDNVFTSRTITFTPTSWPTCTTTGTSMRTASSSTLGLAPPYLLQSFPIANLKNPYSAQSAQKGIQLNTVGTTLGTYSFNPIQIGRTTNASDYNIFDALGQGIEATNCNLLSLNNVFQNTQQFTVSIPNPPYSYLFGGNGIRDIIGNDFNAELSLSANINDPNYGNRFYDCHYGVNCDKVYSFDCKYATFRSTQSNTNTTTVAPGNTGISLRTNRMFYNIWNSNIANINTAINIPLSLSTYTYGSSSSGYGIYAGSIEIKDNYIGAQINPTTTIGNEYVNKAVSISLPMTNLLSTYTNTDFVIVTNTLNNVYRGIDINGISKTTFPATINDNTITLQEDNAFYVNQNAIKLSNNSAGLTKTNTLSAVSTTNQYVSLLFETYNVTGTTTCNDLSNSYQGFVFDNTNLAAIWAGNSMQTNSIGLVLSNNGSIGTQGNSTHPIDNAWNGSWTSANCTYVDGNSNASTSKLYVQFGSPWTPTNNGSIFPSASYNQAGNLNLATGAYSCATPVTSTIISNLIMPLDSVTDANYIYIANTNSYRFLMDHDSIRNSDSTYIYFCEAFSGTTIDVLKQVENAFCIGDFTTAYDLNSTIFATNAVEYYYQAFYTLYYNYETNNFSYYDSLYYLANACPGYYGPAIYQGRALYNYIYSGAFNFSDGCGGGGGLGRAQNTPGSKTISNATKTWDCTLFPNPANNFVTLVSKNRNENLIIEVSDLNGKILLNKNIRTDDGYSGNLDLDLSNGMYFVKITNSKNEKTIKKLVISK